jgi:hypothetical protein
MDALIEVHDGAELDRALRLKSPLIGINNRDLNTFETTLETTRTLAPRVPEGRMVISESGLFTPADLAEMAGSGARSFLIGESLMRQADVAGATRELLANPAGAARMSGKLTHFDAAGQAHMVDVSDKEVTARLAVAEGHVRCAPRRWRWWRPATRRRAMSWASRGWPGSWGRSGPPT